MKAIEAAERILEFAPMDVENYNDKVEHEREVEYIAAQYIEHLATVTTTLDGHDVSELKLAWQRRTFGHRWTVACILSERFCDDQRQAMNDLRPG